MSELLVGFDMPTDMAVFLAIDNGIVYAKTAQMKDWKRLDGVSVHHIPPHGRLIDADAVMSYLNIFNDGINGDEHFMNGIETAKEVIENVPTIIEAEDGE